LPHHLVVFGTALDPGPAALDAGHGQLLWPALV
jgi:hypothetical protein